MHYVWRQSVSLSLSISPPPPHLAPVSVPELDGHRPKNWEDFTEMVVVQLLVLTSQCLNTFFTL
jgi:hypothetical protein